MARYDYKCSSCGNVFEVEHPMSETPEWLLRQLPAQPLETNQPRDQHQSRGYFFALWVANYQARFPYELQ